MDTKKVLVAYDGSGCANDALEDLRRAGLPSELDLLVVSVAEVWVPGADVDADEEESTAASPIVGTLSERARAGLERAETLAKHAANRIRESFPGWTIETRVYPDSPAWGVLYAAEEWKPDMIILGSHGRSALGRFFIGSVSQKVLSEAFCSVRIARRSEHVKGSPVRLLVGVDGTPDSEAAVNEIASRTWPAGSSVKVLSVIGPIGVFVDPVFAYEVMQWTDGQAGAINQREHMERVTGDVAARLRAAGLLVDTAIRDGAPVPLILAEAESLGADCIFLGARGHRFMERFLLGSVSSAIAVRAVCSVEVIRTAKGAVQAADHGAEP